jgi:hypothetical protein
MRGTVNGTNACRATTRSSIDDFIAASCLRGRVSRKTQTPFGIDSEPILGDAIDDALGLVKIKQPGVKVNVANQAHVNADQMESATTGAGADVLCQDEATRLRDTARRSRR